MTPINFRVGAAWAILPDIFELLQKSADKININSEEYLENGRDSGHSYIINDSIATINIYGPLLNRKPTWYIETTSYHDIELSISTAAYDSKVSGILLNIDSPGGTITGILSVVYAINQAKLRKPVVCFASGMMASAAYWIGSAADVIIAEKTSEIGSIGVLMVHTDLSEMEKQEGIKRTYITAGKYKAIGNSSEPLSDEAKGKFQDDLNEYYSVFLNSVAENRDITIKEVASMADGKIFVGEKAKDIGLVDKIGGLNHAIKEIKERVKNKNGGKMETLSELIAKYPDLVKQAMDEAISKFDEEKIKTESAEDTKQELLSLAKIFMGEKSAEQFEKIINSGVSPDQFRSVMEILEESKVETETTKIEDKKIDKQAKLDEIILSGAQNPGVEKKNDIHDFETAVKNIMENKKLKLGSATSEAVKLYPDLHSKYLELLKK